MVSCHVQYAEDFKKTFDVEEVTII